MRILRVADVADNRTGGMSRAMYFTGDLLRDRGHTIDYLFSEQMPSRVPAQLRRFTVPMRIPGLARRLCDARGRYDAVEIHEPLAAPYSIARKVDTRLPPLVVMSHGLNERMHAAELSYRRGKGLPVSLKQRYSPLTVIQQAKYAVRHADHVVCLSEEDERHLRAAGVPAHRITRGRNGVTPDILEAGTRLARHPASRRGVLFIGTWIERKGTMEIVAAMRVLLPRYRGLRLTIAGSGASADAVLADFPAELRARIDVMPAYGDNDTLIELCRHHSVCLLPSFFEGQPLAMLEAAAMGMALVVSRTCGMADFVRDGQNGFAVPVADARAFTERLDALVRDEDLARTLGASARRDAQDYTWLRAADLLETAYRAAARRAGT